MTRRALVLSAAAALLAAGPAAAGPRSTGAICATGCFAAPAGSGPLLVFTGHGWGHGVGLSQYGAYGYAQHGWTYPQILAHYYPGTTPTTTPNRLLRILLTENRKTLTVTSAVPFRVRDGGGATHTLAAGSFTLNAKTLALPVDGAAAPAPLTAPLTFLPGRGAPLQLAHPWRGQLFVDVVGGTLRVVDVVALESYLRGVVPAEMPSTWSAEALKAQAVAARSYALAARRIGAPFDLYADTRSQMYLGIARETPATDAAVASTAHQILTYGGKVADTVFSSTSGGQTASSLDVWGTFVPYLVSVPDPYDVISPFHDWGPVPVTAQTFLQRLKLTGTVLDATLTLNASSRVADLDVATLPPFGFGPTTTQVASGRVAAALGLRSTWFDVGILSLLGPDVTTPVPYGTSVQLTGLVRGVGAVSLETRAANGSWLASGAVSPALDGTVALTETPAITTDYRLATPAAAVGYVRINVAPLVTLTAATAAGVSGNELPALAAAPVQVQQQNPDTTWSTVATGVTNPDGSFSIPAALADGSTIRLVVAPGHGYAAATTAPLAVTG
ncbi:MAG: SpoIID/LytB domain-containing protein [Gaiellaceae bacterium]